MVASLAAPFGITLDAAGDVYVTDTGHNTVIEVDSAGQSTVPFTGLNSPTGVAVDPAGNVYVANDGNGAIVRLTPDGTQTTIDTKPGAAGIAAVAQGNAFDSERRQQGTAGEADTGWHHQHLRQRIQLPGRSLRRAGQGPDDHPSPPPRPTTRRSATATWSAPPGVGPATR